MTRAVNTLRWVGNRQRRWWIGVFLVSRIVMFWLHPTQFSEIVYSYMPFAHLWASGVMPYREQWYEYPPATIPLFYIPHLIDRQTHGKPWHLNYSLSYRAELFVIDIALFWLILHTLHRWRVKPKQRALALGTYLILGIKAHDFWFDTMDLPVAAALLFGVTAWTWGGQWLATALKLINAPLIPLLAAVAARREPWWRVAAKVALAGVLVWGVPIVLFRTSLSVTLVYHQLRGLQVDSVPAMLVRTANLWTKSERVIEVYKNYEMAGPVTDVVLQVVRITFPLAILNWLLVTYWRVRKRELDASAAWPAYLTLGYLLIFLLSGKVLSRPFLLWLPPLYTILPFVSVRQQLRHLFPLTIALFSTLSWAPNWQLGVVPFPLLIGWIRTICLVWLLVEWWRLGEPKLRTLPTPLSPPRP